MSIYRKYRPKKFADVLGQENVVQTLRGALLSGQVGHAYILSGIRGTGKTSIARIFARALNCLDLNGHEPCGACDICKEIDTGSFLDLIEIDAASNRGIEDIRDLREKVRFSPNRGKYKVYIIDEVHMLTNEAFNALLKTLEEPPAHAIFIFATTEIHKIPPTILSRCQRLDFGKIPSKEMVDGIKRIAGKEGIKIDDKSAMKISSLSEGSIRDAFSYLDQISSFVGNKEITMETLEDVLGISSEERLLEVMRLVKEADPKKVIGYFVKLAEDGLDFENFIKDLVKFLRSVMIYKITGDDNEFLDGDRVKNISSPYAFEELIGLIEAMNDVVKNIKNHFIPQLPIEIGITRYLMRLSPKNNTTKSVSERNPPEKKEDIGIKEKDFSAGIRNESAPKKGIEKFSEASSSNSFIERLKEKKVVLYSIIRNCEVIDEEKNIVLCTNNGFYYDTISKRENLDSIREVLKEENILKGIVVRKRDSERTDKNIISSALSVFGGEVID